MTGWEFRPGVVVLLVVLMALVMFYFAEIAEAYFGEPKQEISWRPHNTIKIAAASLLVAACGLLFVLGQPTPHGQVGISCRAIGQKI